MAKASKRTRQVADMIQREISTALRQEIKDPRLANVVITDVVVTPDLKIAKVYFTLLNEIELSPAQEALDKASGHFRHIIATHMELRYTPVIHFYYDQTTAHAEHLDQLLKKVPTKDNETY
jgi:ribosome-binding factor A